MIVIIIVIVIVVIIMISILRWKQSIEEKTVDIHFLSGPNRYSERPIMMISLEGHHGDPNVLGKKILSLQKKVSFHRIIPEKKLLLVEYEEKEVGRETVRMAIHGKKDQQSLMKIHETVSLGISTQMIVDAANRRRIPVRRLNEDNLVMLGWGKERTMIQAALTSFTGQIGVMIAQDKMLTKQLLEAALPVPRGRVITNRDEAWTVAQTIGMPVVVKPLDANQGNGVSVRPQTRSEMEKAYDAASVYGEEVLIERFIAGNDYRLLVVGGNMVAAARREPPSVIGDGKRTIEQLVDELHNDPQRGDGHDRPLSRVLLDDHYRECLRRQGHHTKSIPYKETRVYLRDNSNLSTGGVAYDVTDRVHPDTVKMAVLASTIVGLDIAGIDIVCDDIRKPLREQGGAIIEVNAAPGLRMHGSRSEAIGDAIVSRLIHKNGRIPIAAVTGVNGKTTTVFLIARMLMMSGKTTGIATTEGIYLGDKRIEKCDCSGPWSAHTLLANPQVEAAVLETARGGIVRDGLGFDEARVGVVLNIGRGDHLGLKGSETIQDLQEIKSVVARHAEIAVLNAHDPLVREMATQCKGEIVYFSIDPQDISSMNPSRRTVVFVEDTIVAKDMDKVVFEMKADNIPLTCNGRLRFQIENVMAAISAAWVMAVPWPVIRGALQSFQSSHGRFDMYSFRDGTIIADYGHNTDALDVLTRDLTAFPAKKKHVIFGAAGDRRDQDIVAMTRLLGQFFDHVVLFEKESLRRGRTPGDTMTQMKKGLAASSNTIQIDEASNEQEAIETILRSMKEGDLALLLVDDTDSYREILLKNGCTKVG